MKHRLVYKDIRSWKIEYLLAFFFENLCKQKLFCSRFHLTQRTALKNPSKHTWTLWLATIEKNQQNLKESHMFAGKIVASNIKLCHHEPWEYVIESRTQSSWKAQECMIMTVYDV